MKKINVALDDQNHLILTKYKLDHGYSTLDKALNELLKEWGARNQLFR